MTLSESILTDVALGVGFLLLLRGSSSEDSQEKRRANPALRFFPAHHHSADAHELKRALLARQNVSLPFEPPDEWLLDSGGFSILRKTGGKYPGTPRDYIRFVKRCEQQQGGTLLGAMAEDYPILEAIDYDDEGSGYAHFEGNLNRYRAQHVAARRMGVETQIVPVAHGRAIPRYVESLRGYEKYLSEGDLVAIGSLLGEKDDAYQTGGDVDARYLVELLRALKQERGDLRYHALGVGKNLLRDQQHGAWLQTHLWSADSAAWSLGAWYEGKDQNDPEEGAKYAREIAGETQRSLFDQERQTSF